MPSDPRLMALPALRKLAEEQARERFDLVRSELRTVREEPVLPLEWEFPANTTRAAWTTAELSMLADLTRPASRWELAALIGARLGWEPVDVLQAIQNGGFGWIDLCKDAHVDAAELECGADDEAITALALAVLGGAS